MDQLEPIKACRALAAPDDRLACYDRAAGELIAASDAGQVQVVTTQEVEKTRRGLFGFSMPKIGLFSNDGDELDLLESEIVSVRNLGRGKFEFRISEGSVWRVSDAPSSMRLPKAGDQVSLKKAALGSYFVRINGRRGVKGRRVE